VRVVHLWQKNNVFPQEIIESLLHLDGSSGLTTDTATTQLHSHSEPVNSSFISGSHSAVFVILNCSCSCICLKKFYLTNFCQTIITLRYLDLL